MNMDPEFGKQETPHQMQRLQGRLPTFAVPKTIIFCDSSPFLKKMLEEKVHVQCDGCFSRLYFLKDHPGVAIGNFGIGASTLAEKMEELISWGVLQFISIGIAGSLQSKAKSGDIVVCEKAIRDELISQRYLPPAKYIHAPRRMTNKLQQQLKKVGIPFHIGSTWTTNRPYRQEAEEVLQYQKEGVMTVEMEAAALFAVAHFYQVDLGAMFAISDSHGELFWQSRPEEETTRKGLETLFRTALEAST